MVPKKWYSNVSYLRPSLAQTKHIVIYLLGTHNAPTEPCHTTVRRTSGSKTNPWVLVSLLMCGCLAGKHPPNELSDSPDVARVRNRALRTYANVKERPLTPVVHASWQILHGVLAYGEEFEIQLGKKPLQDTKKSALDYLLDGGELSGWDFIPGEKLPNGRRGLRSSLKAGSYAGQGHRDQWLAVLAQSNLTLKQELTVDGQKFSLEDLLQQTMLDVASNTEREFSWTLIGLTKYKPTSSTWVATGGSEWSVEKLIGYELDSNLHASACGGSHRLIGIAMALEKRRQEGRKILGIWQQAADRLREIANLARTFQNSDGSFSTHYFERPGVSADNATVLATTGHTLELLALTLPPDELRQPWVLQAVDRLCELLEDSEEHALECGALYHAIHGLKVFHERTADI